ncbi:MAG: toxin-antitoxin system YwqK family antitoxin [Bacteroidota bacterium]
MRFFLTAGAIFFFIFCLKGNVVLGQDNDTINRTDENSMKQGHWIIMDESNSFKVEEGRYQDNKKVGIWKGYYENGKIKHELTFVSGRANGYAKFYYDNGNLSEEGLWKSNKWVGEYKFYHRNGNPAYVWQYNDGGKRTGEQKYYHENGALMIEGKWEDGKEKGVIKEYYDDGSLKAEKNFNDGKLDTLNVKIYAKNNPNPTNNNNTTNNNVVIENNTNNNSGDPVGYFNGNGQHTLYKTIGGVRKIDREGNFKDGKLISGKQYYYDSSGTLTKTVVLNNGKIVDIIYPE